MQIPAGEQKMQLMNTNNSHLEILTHTEIGKKTFAYACKYPNRPQLKSWLHA